VDEGVSETFLHMMTRLSTVVVLAGSLLLGAGQLAAHEPLLRWHDRLEIAQQKARESGKPIFVVFRCVR
jgi:hypothetical protein